MVPGHKNSMEKEPPRERYCEPHTYLLPKQDGEGKGSPDRAGFSNQPAHTHNVYTLTPGAMQSFRICTCFFYLLELIFVTAMILFLKPAASSPVFCA